MFCRSLFEQRMAKSTSAFFVFSSMKIESKNPTLEKEWDYEKNCDLKPTDFTSNSGKKVWWICTQKHEWQSTIYNRNKGHGSPECARQKRKKP